MSPQEEDRIIDAAYRDVVAAYLASNHRRKVEVIERAFRFAREAHRGRRRRSGEPYILHPLAVAKIVISELGLGSTSICSALLHEVLEDADYARDDIADNFGDKIAAIVEGLAKISGGIMDARSTAQAENFRNLLLSMSTDIRVVLVKMADRLHNMRTLQFVRPEKQLKVAGETLYIYAPLAHRLGLHKIKSEFEDLAFRYEHPQEYAEIKEMLKATEEERKAIVEEFIAPVKEKLDAAGLKYEIRTRVKSAYSIWNKMHKKNIGFDEVYDVYAIRVIFENDDEAMEKLLCYKIYGIFTDGYTLHPERTRDWVSSPKANGYQALHLTAMGPKGKWVEVQIRSRKMDDIAELGYAAHWKYKEGIGGPESALDKCMGTIKDILAHPEPTSLDFLDTIRLNLFTSEIYVFTPRGEVKRLPKGSTVLDLAYAIHTDIGEHCIAGKINHKLKPLSHELDSGDQVEIITAANRHPESDWIGYAVTARAKAKIGQYLRKNES
ncbi:MAG: bifunctional (p)ppGpp synthetase/guanosine-3',5'-bis(diphosphate) 3'-pyrophosphohydrolase [Muribaculaceae bacterium]|nr:bifunctional (p)ppGpp synthetase/guanosine-3',5'-bis(diphosphate) 3'-pyrophosphohydrolase [Muribaculaceae bacterium]